MSHSDLCFADKAGLCNPFSADLPRYVPLGPRYQWQPPAVLPFCRGRDGADVIHWSHGGLVLAFSWTVNSQRCPNGRTSIDSPG